MANYTNSPLVDKYILTDHNYGLRTHKIDRITIHHMAGDFSVEVCGNIFQNPERRASSNYSVGTDGRIGMYVEEVGVVGNFVNILEWISDDEAERIMREGF